MSSLSISLNPLPFLFRPLHLFLHLPRANDSQRTVNPSRGYERHLRAMMEWLKDYEEARQRQPEKQSADLSSAFNYPPTQASAQFILLYSSVKVAKASPITEKKVGGRTIAAIRSAFTWYWTINHKIREQEWYWSKEEGRWYGNPVWEEEYRNWYKGYQRDHNKYHVANQSLELTIEDLSVLMEHLHNRILRSETDPTEWKTYFDEIHTRLLYAYVPMSWYIFARSSEVRNMLWKDIQFDRRKKGSPHIVFDLWTLTFRKTNQWDPKMANKYQIHSPTDPFERWTDVRKPLRDWRAFVEKRCGFLPTEGNEVFPSITSQGEFRFGSPINPTVYRNASLGSTNHSTAANSSVMDRAMRESQIVLASGIDTLSKHLGINKETSLETQMRRLLSQPYSNDETQREFSRLIDDMPNPMRDGGPIPSIQPWQNASDEGMIPGATPSYRDVFEATITTPGPAPTAITPTATPTALPNAHRTIPLAVDSFTCLKRWFFPDPDAGVHQRMKDWTKEVIGPKNQQHYNNRKRFAEGYTHITQCEDWDEAKVLLFIVEVGNTFSPAFEKVKEVLKKAGKMSSRH